VQGPHQLRQRHAADFAGLKAPLMRCNWAGGLDMAENEGVYVFIEQLAYNW